MLQKYNVNKRMERGIKVRRPHSSLFGRRGCLMQAMGVCTNSGQPGKLEKGFHPSIRLITQLVSCATCNPSSNERNDETNATGSSVQTAQNCCFFNVFFFFLSFLTFDPRF